PDAVALVDLIATATDTITDPGEVSQDPYDGRPHIPLPFELRQQSYSWADPPLDDFVMFECFLTNIGTAPMSDVWVGIYMDADVYHIFNQATGYIDDITGYLPGAKTAYIMDNDGDPDLGNWVTESAKGVFGVKYHGSNPPRDNINYNWWISNSTASLDFGPRLAGTPGDPFRDFGSGGLGTATGDKNKYYMLSHNEVDYDQLFTAVSHTGEGFLPPPAPLYAEDLANGYDTRFLLSFGPYDIAAGDSIRFYFSIVMGADAHVGAGDFLSSFAPSIPQPYYDLLDFSDLIANLNTADSLYEDLFDLSLSVDGDNNPSLSMEYELAANYPNPFNPTTMIAYTLPRQSDVELSVFNLLGQKIAVLAEGSHSAGTHEVVWNGRDMTGQSVASGVYFYRLSTNETTLTKKMLLLK
ncbi:MAG: T9SS type A sorting domain-containing protein, partial [FCB group bacterium]|nr:T9SS type A sorting domain-containing protein [FCB group bacterium]